LPRKYRVGQTLYSCLDGTDFDKELFCIVDLLNAGTKDTSVELAMLNLRAAKKAKVFGALSSQASYSQIGLDLLPADRWKQCKHLSLELHTIRAEAASGMGGFSTMGKYCDIVFHEEECSILDKIPCYKVWIHNFSRQKKYEDAIQLALEVLGKLGCNLPRWSTSQAAKAMLSLADFKQGLKKKTATSDELLVVPLMADPLQKQIMSLLDSLTHHTYVTKNHMVWLLTTIVMVRKTQKYGLTDESQIAFASMAVMITHVFGDWKMGGHYAILGLKMYDDLLLEILAS
jgi:predicted ATPase